MNNSKRYSQNSARDIAYRRGYVESQQEAKVRISRLRNALEIVVNELGYAPCRDNKAHEFCERCRAIDIGKAALAKEESRD